MVVREFVDNGESLMEDTPLIERARNFHKFTTGDPIAIIKVVIPIFIGCAMIWFGLTTSGSYYEPESRMSGFLSQVWYIWQMGTLMAMAGTILVYDAIKRTGYL